MVKSGGTKYQRVEEGEFKGQLLLNESGLPQALVTSIRLVNNSLTSY